MNPGKHLKSQLKTKHFCFLILLESQQRMLCAFQCKAVLDPRLRGQFLEGSRRTHLVHTQKSSCAATRGTQARHLEVCYHLCLLLLKEHLVFL